MTEKLLYVGHTNPWGLRSGSGYSPKICNGLQASGLLYGGIHPFDPDAEEYLHGAGYNSFWSGIRRRFLIRQRMDIGLVQTEAEGCLPTFLERLKPGSPVVYHFHTPKYDERFDLRRYLFQDLTPSDAIKFGAYGHEDQSETQRLQKIEKIGRVIHSSQTAGILTYSTYGADSIASEYNFPRERIFAVGCGPIRSLDISKSITIDRYEAGRILFVGRSWEKKGGPLLLEAFNLLKEGLDTRHAKLCIVGPKNQPKETIGVDGVEFIGRVSDRAVARAFERSSVFCMLPHCETWGIVYVEAANAGLPIVGIDKWALPDIVTQGETGLLVSERDPVQIADALAQLISSAQEAMMMGTAASRRVKNVLAWEHVLNRFKRAIWPHLVDEVRVVPLR